VTGRPKTRNPSGLQANSAYKQASHQVHSIKGKEFGFTDHHHGITGQHIHVYGGIVSMIMLHLFWRNKSDIYLGQITRVYTRNGKDDYFYTVPGEQISPWQSGFCCERRITTKTRHSIIPSEMTYSIHNFKTKTAQ
jgi:hypothetical protein